MDKVGALVRLTRPVFLLGGALLYALGAALSSSSIDWIQYGAGQALVTTVQLAAQYANEYYDLEADRLAGAARTWLTGGSGVLSSGRLGPVTALRAAVIATAAALVMTALVAGFSGRTALVGLVALAGAWAYSAPPARLVATVYGVTTASLIVAVLTPLTGALIQESVPADRFVAVAIPLLLLHHAMLIAFEHPDRLGDEAAGKQTLSVRLGPTASKRLHGLLLAASFTAIAVAVWLGPLGWSEGGWALALAPVGVVQARLLPRAPGALLATVAVSLFSGTTLALLVGLV